MANTYFSFKQFTIHQDRSAMKVTTDACLFGAWLANDIAIQSTDIGTNALDIGTGSGLLSLMLSQKFKGSIDAVEIDEAAARQAMENVQLAKRQLQIQIHCADVLQFPKKKYDILFSNPPFYEDELRSPDSRRNKAHHEGGLKLSELFPIINEQLAPDGHFYLLLPYKRLDEIMQMMTAAELPVYRLTTVRQTPRHTPFRLMIKGGMQQQSPELTQDTITIRNVDENYSAEFSGLLKDYYLNL